MIFLAFDQPYTAWATLFLASLRHFHADLPVCAGAVDLSDEQVSYVQNEFGITEVRRFHVPVWGEARAAAIANSRPYWFRDLVRSRGADNYLMVDADLLLRAPIFELFEIMAGCDAALVFRAGVHLGRTWSRRKIAAGMIGIGQSGTKLLDQWINVMERSSAIDEVEPWEWFWEQTCLYQATKRTPLRYGTIPAERFLCSPPFRTDAVVWSANVSRDLKASVFSEFKLELSRLRHEDLGPRHML